MSTEAATGKYHAMRDATEWQRPYVLLPSGGIIDLAAPDPASWSDEDLALGLARTYRWGGHSRWPLPLSVAQHSLSVLALRQAAGDPTPRLQLYELLHDAEEALLGFDCISPLKQFLGPEFLKLSARLTAAIAVRYHLPALTACQYAAHKLADRTTAASEALHVAGWSRQQIRETLLIAETPQGIDPLDNIAANLGYLPWEPWPSEVATAQWLQALRTAQGTAA